MKKSRFTDSQIIAVQRAMEHMHEHSDVWLGWTWWAAGPRWSEYMFTLTPSSETGEERAQLQWLRPYLDQTK